MDLNAAEVERLERLYFEQRFVELEQAAQGLVARFPNIGFVWSVLAAALQAQGKVSLDAYRHAAQLLPDDGDAQFAYAGELLASGLPHEAVAVYQRGIALAPMQAVAHNNLGNALTACSERTAAQQSYRRAIELDPHFALAAYNLALCERDLGQVGLAISWLKRSIELDSTFAQAHLELGALLKGTGAMDQSLKALEAAIRAAPQFATAHLNLGAALLGLGRSAEAQKAFRTSLELEPASAEANAYMGMSLLDEGKTHEALGWFERALTLQPNHTPTLIQVSGIYAARGDLAHAITLLQRALAQDPTNPTASSALLFYRAHFSDIPPATQFADHVRFGQLQQSIAGGAEHATATRAASAGAPVLRVGWVSGDFCNHIVARCLAPVLTQLARFGELELTGYYNHHVHDEWTERLRSCFKQWRPIVGMSTTAVAELVRQDGIDILIDLSGHTGQSGLAIFARKPAPLQLSWLGYTWTTGLSAVDYYLTDAHWLPPGEFDDMFVEKLAYLPAWLPFTFHGAAPGVGPLPARKNNHITFGSFNHFRKINADVLATWSELLHKLPSARLAVGAIDDMQQRLHLTKQFAQLGIDISRVRFLDRCDAWTYMQLHHEVDICLDAFPFPSATTIQHALWMGVPTVTLAGGTPLSCAGAGVMRQLGLDSFVTADTSEYVRVAIAWAQQIETLAALREKLRADFGNSAMGQPTVIANALRDLLFQLWENQVPERRSVTPP